MERFVHVILHKLGPFALRIGEIHTVWCISLSVYVHYIHCVYGHSGVECKDYLYTFLYVVLIVKISFILFACCVYAYCLHVTYILTQSVIKSQRAR